MSAPRIADLLRAARQRLAGPQAALEAQALLAHVLGRPRSHLLAWPERPVAAAAAARFRTLLARRAAGEPLAYLTGEREFWSLPLRVTPAVLIPRPETELLVELTLAQLPAGPCGVADLGTGSGAIALALASERPAWRLDASDASAAALAVARDNARRLDLAARVAFHHGPWYAALPRGVRYHALVSNPPYVASGDPHLTRGDLPFEPRAALAAGPDGLAALRALVDGAPDRLHPGGWLLLEHGHDQGAAVRALLRARGFVAVATHRDLAGLPRATLGRLPHAALPRPC